MSDWSWVGRLPRFRRGWVGLGLLCASSLAVGAVATAVVTALAGALTPGLTSAQAGLPGNPAVGALLGFSVFMPSMSIWLSVVLEKPRAARWAAAGFAAAMVLLLTVRLRDSVTWYSALLAAVAFLSLYLLSPRLLVRRTEPPGPRGRPQRGRRRERANRRGRGRS